jgi:hypothetical protein
MGKEVTACVKKPLNKGALHWGLMRGSILEGMARAPCLVQSWRGG